MDRGQCLLNLITFYLLFFIQILLNYMQRNLAFNVILLQFKYFFPNLLGNFALEDFSV